LSLNAGWNTIVAECRQNALELRLYEITPPAIDEGFVRDTDISDF
jgi:hypothetical protein